MVYHRCGIMPVPLRAAAGDTRLTLQFCGTVAGAHARILLDTGAAGCFANLAWCKEHKVDLKPHAGSAELPSGETLHYASKATLGVRIQGLNCHETFSVLPLTDDYDVILGDPWAQKHDAVLDFGSPPCVRIPKRTKVHVLYPNGACEPRLKPPPAPTLLTAMQVKRMLRGDLRCVYGIVKRTPASHYTDASDPNHPMNRPDPRLSLDPDVRELVDQFADIFQDTPPGLPPERGIPHPIPLEEGAKPPWRPVYRLSPAEHADMQRQITELLAKGWVEPSSSPYGAPILFVGKKDGGLRMCIDYRALNKLTIKNRYPLPRIDDLFDQLRGAQFFTSIDLAQGYHQIRISPEDAPKTAFRTPTGHFQFKVLCFGLTNAPATFQQVMNEIFKHQVGKFVLVYLDDILIFSRSREEHLRHLREALEVLRANTFYARLHKCFFLQEEIE